MTLRFVTALLFETAPAAVAAVYAATGVTSWTSFALLHVGRRRASGFLFSAGIWAVGATAEILYGVHTGAPIVHLLAIVLAGFFWSARAANGVAIVSVLWLGAAAYAEATGLLPEPPALSPYRMWVSVSLCLLFVAMLIGVALRGKDTAIHDARKSAEEARASQIALERSVAERRKSDEARRRLERQLGDARRLEAVGRLAGGVAHDFNNLLTIVLANASVLRRRVASREDDACLQEIEQAGKRAADLTRQLLAIGGRQVREARVVSLGDVVEPLEPLLRRLLPENIDLEIRSGREVPPVCTDVAQLEQVVVNLVANARDAMPDGGRLTIETRAVDLPGVECTLDTVPAARPGRYAALEVRDTGEGMDEATRQSVFEPFFTTKRRGTGLGLATVHGIVSQNAGHVWVESELGRGSRFVVLLPGTEAPGIEATPRPPSRPEIETLSGVVLLAEDEVTVRSVLERVLRGSGLEVHAVPSAEDALALERELPRVDLLVTDVVMPGISGTELGKRIRDRRAGLPVLLVSGHPADAMPETPAEPGVAFLHKPFTERTLLERVHALLQADREAAEAQAG